MLEVDVATGASRVFASGLRNPTGLQWEPQTGKLWAIVNERDEIGADLVPDYLTSVQGGRLLRLAVQLLRPARRRARQAAAARPGRQGHQARLRDRARTSRRSGCCSTPATNLPSAYRGGAFIGEHGSWDRSPLSGYEVSYVRFVDGRPTGPVEPVVTGFYSADEESLYGAPVGLAQGADGALLIADDVGNAVWAVTASK